jgi:hypothetical protein
MESNRARVPSWIAVPTTAPTRVNIFSVAAHSPRHVATIIAPGEKSIPNFKTDVALMSLSPEICNLLVEVDYLLSSYQAIKNPQFTEMRRKIKNVLSKSAVG